MQNRHSRISFSRLSISCEFQMSLTLPKKDSFKAIVVGKQLLTESDEAKNGTHFVFIDDSYTASAYMGRKH